MSKTIKPLIIYDFDGTLTPYAWTKFAILEKCGLEGGGSNPEFIRRVMKTAELEHIDTYASLWQVYLSILRENNLSLTDDNFSLGASSLEFNPGVPDFLRRMQDNSIHNIILSSSIKVFLDQTAIAPYFSDIFATTFTYDQNHQATGVDFLMTEKNKVSVIRDILKKYRHDATDATAVTYIGDGLTDFYAMDYIKNHGGQSIFVYHDATNPTLAKLRTKGTVSFATSADFSQGSELDKLLNRQFFPL